MRRLDTFLDTSIRSKLLASSVLGTAFALALACAVFIVYDVFTFRESVARRLATQAEIVGANSVSALLFNDPEAATTTLRALRAEPQILAAAVFGKDGTPFARYDTVGHAGDIPVEAPRPNDAKRRFEHGHVILLERIVSDGETIGTVYIVGDLAEMRQRVARYAATALVVLLLSLGVGMLFAARLQRIIVEPILELARTVRSVAADKNYAVRAFKRRNDETGVLVDSFNEMLSEIQRRDGTLTMEIAERKRAEARAGAARDTAVEASRVKTAFLANMSHEIRTPLNVILGFGGMIADHLEEIGDHSQKELLRSVERGSLRLMNTMHAILDLSSIEAGDFQIRPKPIELAPFVERELASFRSLAAEKALTLTFEVGTPGVIVTFDPYCLTQAVTNLVDNAIKFTEKGTVSVRFARDEKGRVSLEIRDTGIGIDEMYLPHLFETFSQEKSGKTRPFDGSGLGVALAKKFVEMNGGTLAVKSRKGEGSTFTIRFAPERRLVDTANREVAAPAAIDRSRPNGTKPRVLVVEDDPDSQRLMRRILSDRYEVSCAASGDEAVRELAGARAVKTILMDVSIKGVEDGLSLTRRLRGDDRWRSIPILAVTAHARPEDQARALAAGCDAYLSKPIERLELLALVAKLAGSAR